MLGIWGEENCLLFGSNRHLFPQSVYLKMETQKHKEKMEKVHLVRLFSTLKHLNFHLEMYMALYSMKLQGVYMALFFTRWQPNY